MARFTTLTDALSKWFTDDMDATLYVKVLYNGTNYLMHITYQGKVYIKQVKDNVLVGMSGNRYNIAKATEVRNLVKEKIASGSINNWDIPGAILGDVTNKIEMFSGWLVVNSEPPVTPEKIVYTGNNINEFGEEFNTPVVGLWLKTTTVDPTEPLQSAPLALPTMKVWVTRDGKLWMGPKGLWVKNI